MRVLHVGKYYPPRWGGMETALKDICETTHSAVDLEVAVAGQKAVAQREVLGEIPVTRLACFGTLFSQPLTPSLFSLLRHTSADLVHLHEPNPLATTAYLASGCSSPLIVHYHSDIVRQKQLRKLYWPLLDRVLGRARAIVTGSRELADNSPVLARHRSKCTVIPFGIDLDPFLDLRRTPVPEDPPMILAVGRLSYYKGFHYLIQAMCGLDARLVIAGEGNQRTALENQIRELGLAHKIRLAGRVSMQELLACYSQAALFCLPSCESSEAFGLAMVEAMAAGLPVVSTDLPTGVRSVNVHGETGLVVPPHSSESLEQALRLLVRHDHLRAQMGDAGRRRARREFSREIMGRRIVELYNSVLCGVPAAPRQAVAP